MIKRGVSGGVEWVRARARAPRGVVFVPPLVGGDAIQQIRMLRPLRRFGLDLYSFNYAGHGRSSGRFSLHAARENCLEVLDIAWHRSQRLGVPLYGVASCFATIPLLQVTEMRAEPMQKVVLINAIPRWRLRIICANFLRYWRLSGRWFGDLDGLPQAIRTYINELLPDVVHQPQAFGVLARHRVQWTRLMYELLSHATLATNTLKQTPVMCIYGRKDRLLQQMGFQNWGHYEGLIQSISPHTRFLPLDAGHFLNCPKVRRDLIKAVARFFGCHQGR